MNGLKEKAKDVIDDAFLLIAYVIFSYERSFSIITSIIVSLLVSYWVAKH